MTLHENTADTAIRRAVTDEQPPTNLTTEWDRFRQLLPALAQLADADTVLPRRTRKGNNAEDWDARKKQLDKILATLGATAELDHGA